MLGARPMDIFYAIPKIVRGMFWLGLGIGIAAAINNLVPGASRQPWHVVLVFILISLTGIGLSTAVVKFMAATRR